MAVSLLIIFLIALTFLVVRGIVLRKIQIDNCYDKPINDNYFPIPSVKIINSIFSFISILYMPTGLFLYEYFYPSPTPYDEISWFIMLASITLSCLYYGLALQMQYFYFDFGDDYMEFNLKIGNRLKDAIKISFQEISSIYKDVDKYFIILKDQRRYSIEFKKIKWLIGSELLKEKLDSYTTRRK